MNREPLLTAGGILAIVAAAVGVVVAFGVQLTDTQTGAILTLVGVLAPLLVAFLGRRKVTPDVDVVARWEDHAGGTVAGQASSLPDGTRVHVTANHPPVV